MCSIVYERLCFAHNKRLRHIIVCERYKPDASAQNQCVSKRDVICCHLLEHSLSTERLVGYSRKSAIRYFENEEATRPALLRLSRVLHTAFLALKHCTILDYTRVSYYIVYNTQHVIVYVYTYVCIYIYIYIYVYTHNML